MTSLPRPPLGNSAEANWMRRLLNCISERTPKGGRNLRVIQNSDGFSLEQISGGSGFTISTYHYKSMESEFIICRTWDGSNEGSSDIYIGKPPELWFSVDSETIRGDDITYDNYDFDNQTRRAQTTTGAPETQRVTRPYIEDDIIWAAPALSFVDPDDVPDNKEVTLIDLNRAGRTWLAAGSGTTPP